MEKMKIRLAEITDVDSCLEIYNAQIDYEAVHGDLTAWRRGCSVLRFDTVSTNIPAQAFYKKYGYVECGRYSGEYMGRSDILYVCLEKVLG